MSKLREALLPFTIRNAARLPFYDRFWKGVDLGSITSLAELQRLPVLSKEEYRSSFMLDRSALSECSFITHTTGTTGPVTWRHRSLGEASLISRLFGTSPSSAGTTLTLAIRYDRHGMAMPMPGRARVFPITLNDDLELNQSLQMLAASFNFSDGVLRPTVLTGGAHDIALLAQAWAEARMQDLSNSIESLHILGFVDAALYDFLHRCFNEANIVEKYSLTEIFGGAVRQWPSAKFTLDSFVIGEVLNECAEPVSRGGVGELVLTELFPFVQMQPLIRYRTGDIVLLASDIGDVMQFEWLGRRNDCILCTQGGTATWILGYRHLADWLSLCSSAARQTHRAHLSVTSSDVGKPCLILGKDPDGIITIRIGLRMNPWWSKDVIQLITRDLWASLQTMILVPPADLRVRLSFGHVSHPTPNFRATSDVHDFLLPPTLLSGPPPVLS
jgi:hypothetical protein